LKTNTSSDANILVIEDLSVNKGQQRLLNGINLAVLRGEIHAILGPPGSGKSTLIRAIMGIIPPTGGRIFFEGRELKRHLPRAAMKLGIEAVLNESTLYPTLSLFDNISISRMPRRRLLFYDTEKLHQAIAGVIQDLSLTLNPARPLSSFSVVEQHLAQLVKAVCLPTRLLLIDEISTKLPPTELEKIKHLLAIIRQRGTTILYSTNNMDEIFNFASRVSILKNGRVASTSRLSDIDKIQLVQMTYSFLSSREELERNNFELFYLKTFYESIFNTIPTPIMVTDTKGTIVVLNDTLKELLKIRSDRPHGTFREALSLADKVNGETWETIKRGEVAHFEVGPARQGISAFALTDEDDAFIGIVFLAGFQQLPHEVSDAHASTEKLIARTAHEIRNPLGIILNYLKLIRTEVSVDRIHEKARLVESEVRRIKHMTEDIQAQSLRKRIRNEGLREILLEVIGLVGPTASSSKVTVTNHLDGDYVLHIETELFKQVILNIMINAVEAMPHGGSLEIRTGLETRGDKDYLVISFVDTGAGIPPDQVESIFEAFFTTKEKSSNQGLGLSISRDIMAGLSGFITVESNPGEGSTFHVFLPREVIVLDPA
jgi:signal transduction histidine kinase/ABC-type multidrug transport system ATPase subunit